MSTPAERTDQPKSALWWLEGRRHKVEHKMLLTVEMRSAVSEHWLLLANEASRPQEYFSSRTIRSIVLRSHKYEVGSAEALSQACKQAHGTLHSEHQHKATIHKYRHCAHAQLHIDRTHRSEQMLRVKSFPEIKQRKANGIIKSYLYCLQTSQ